MLESLVLRQQFDTKLDHMIAGNVPHHLQLLARDVQALGQSLADLSFSLPFGYPLDKLLKQRLQRSGSVAIHP